MANRLLFMAYVNMQKQKGDSVWVRETVINFKKIGYDIELITINPPFILSDIRCYKVPFLRKMPLPLVWNFVSLLYGLYSCLFFKPHLIYADTPAGSVSPAILSILTGKTLILEVHGPAGAQDIALFRRSSEVKIAIARRMERIMLRRAHLVISAKGWAQLLRELYKIPNERLLIRPLAINREMFCSLDMYSQRQKLGLPQNVPIAVFVGNVSPWQGLDTLVRAAPITLAQYPETLFLIVGEGAALRSLKEQVRQSKVDHRFSFIGEVSYDQVPYYIAAANVGLALFPKNRGHLGGISALKTLNYLACGRPVIVTDMDEMAEEIDQKGAGKMIPSENPVALAEALSWVFSQPDNGAKLRQKAAILGESLPSWENVVNAISIRLRSLIMDTC